MNAGSNNNNYIDNKKKEEEGENFFDTNEEIDYLELIKKNQNLKLENKNLKLENKNLENELEQKRVQFNLKQANNEQKLQNLENENKLALKKYNEEITRNKEVLTQDFQKQLKDLNTKHELKIKNLEKTIAEKEKTIAEKEKTIAEKEKTIAYQNNEISSFQSQINELKAQKKDSSQNIKNLQELNLELTKYKKLYKEIAGNNIESFTGNQRKNINTFQREFVKLIVLKYYAELIEKSTSTKITNPFDEKIPRKNIIKKNEEDNKVLNFLETRFNEIKKVFNIAKEPISKKITSKSEKIKKTANNYYKKIKESSYKAKLSLKIINLKNLLSFVAISFATLLVLFHIIMQTSLLTKITGGFFLIALIPIISLCNDLINQVKSIFQNKTNQTKLIFEKNNKIINSSFSKVKSNFKMILSLISLAACTSLIILNLVLENNKMLLVTIGVLLIASIQFLNSISESKEKVMQIIDQENKKDIEEHNKQVYKKISNEVNKENFVNEYNIKIYGSLKNGSQYNNQFIDINNYLDINKINFDYEENLSPNDINISTIEFIKKSEQRDQSPKS